MKIRRGGRRVPGHGLADEEQRRDQRREPEGQQAGGLVRGHPVHRIADLLQVVPDVDVRPPRHPGQVGPEGRNRGLAAFEPDQRVDVGLPVCAHHVGAVPREQGGRGEDATGRPGRVSVETPRSTADAYDPGPDLRAERRPGGSVVPLVGLLHAGQLQGERVTHVLAGGRGELRRNDDLVGAARVEQPSGHHDGPLDGARHLVVGQREPAAGRRVSLGLEPEHHGELGQRGDFGQGRDLGPVEPRLVGQHRSGRGQRAGPEPVESSMTPAGACDRGQDGRGGQRDEQGQDRQ